MAIKVERPLCVSPGRRCRCACAPGGEGFYRGLKLGCPADDLPHPPSKFEAYHGSVPTEDRIELGFMVGEVEWGTSWALKVFKRDQLHVIVANSYGA